MRKNEDDYGRKLIHILTCVLSGGFISFGVNLMILAAAAALISAGRIPEGAMEQVALGASVAGCFFGGLYAVLRCRARVLLVGMAVAAVFYLLWVTAGLLTCGSAGVLGNLRVLCAGLLGGTVSGFLGARPKKRRK